MIWHLDLFSGIGGFSIASDAVWKDVVHTFVEYDPFCQAVLTKHWPTAKLYGDIHEFVKLCKENAHDAEKLMALLSPIEIGDGKGDTVEIVSRNIIENGDTRIANPITQGSRHGGGKSGSKPSRKSEENADVVEKKIPISSRLTTSTTTDISTDGPMENGEYGLKPSKTKTRINATKSSATTVTTLKQISGNAPTKYERPFILTGGFPCQPFSTAGRRKGTDDHRYLWPPMLEAITLFKPRWVIAENVRGLVTWNDGMVLETVCSDLEREGYEVWPLIIPAASVGAPHRRDRVWIVANRIGERLEGGGAQSELQEPASYSRLPRHVHFGEGSDASNSAMPRLEGSTRTLVQRNRERFANGNRGCWNEDWPSVAARLCGVSYGLPAGMDFALRRVEDEYGTPYQKDRGKSMRNMREALCAPQVRETFGRLYQIPDTEVLLETMRGIPEHSYEEWLDATSDPIQEGFLRELWEQREIRRASRGWRHNEQLAEKHQNALPQVPYEASLAIAEAWHRVRFAQQAYEAEGYKLKGSRNSRLKALGNAIVPQVAEMIMRAIKAADV